MTRTGHEATRQNRGLLAPVEAARRQVLRPQLVPSTRVVVGAFLMTTAAFGTLLAWHYAARDSLSTYVVASRDLRPGEQLTPDDVEMVRMELPGATSQQAFTTGQAVEGLVLLGPVGEGELLQATQVSTESYQGAEVAFALPVERAVAGTLQEGELVDVFATTDGQTRMVLEGARLHGLADTGTMAAGSSPSVTVMLGFSDLSRREDLVHALDVGQVTLVRSPDGPAATPVVIDESG